MSQNAKRDGKRGEPRPEKGSRGWKERPRGDGGPGSAGDPRRQRGGAWLVPAPQAAPTSVPPSASGSATRAAHPSPEPRPAPTQAASAAKILRCCRRRRDRETRPLLRSCTARSSLALPPARDPPGRGGGGWSRGLAAPPLQPALLLPLLPGAFPPSPLPSPPAADGALGLGSSTPQAGADSSERRRRLRVAPGTELPAPAGARSHACLPRSTTAASGGDFRRMCARAAWDLAHAAGRNFHDLWLGWSANAAPFTWRPHPWEQSTPVG